MPVQLVGTFNSTLKWKRQENKTITYNNKYKIKKKIKNTVNKPKSKYYKFIYFLTSRKTKNKFQIGFDFWVRVIIFLRR